MNIDDVYNQLTDVDIKEQKILWDERGKGYYGEYLVFCELYRNLEGRFKILMNLNIPVNNSTTTEIDLLLIHETGLYVFEMKHYKGTIYGKSDDNKWTQYFPTRPNHSFNNPINQNKYHINALKQLYPDVPIYSCIVFTNAECTLKIENNAIDTEVITISKLSEILNKKFFHNKRQYSMEQLNDMFNKLSAYSSMKKPVIIDYKKADFLSWIQPTIYELEAIKKEKEDINQKLLNSIEENKREFKQKAEKMQKDSNKKVIIFAIIMAIIVIASLIFASNRIKNNTNELNTFKQKFLHIDQINNEYINDLSSYIDVSNQELLPLTDDAVSFTARISITNTTYGIALTKESTYIVMTENGNVYEYNVFGDHLKFNASANMLGTGIRDYGDLAKSQFYGISNLNDISYIKLTGISLFQLDSRRTVIKDNLEIELYSK